MKIRTVIWKKLAMLAIVFALIFPWQALPVLADPVPVEEVGWNREWNFRTSEYTNSLVELMGEVMAPIYQLATPGSNLTYDIYRYLMKHTEDELGIDKDFFRRMQKKQKAPSVDIVFAPTNPREGERVTAFAIPRDFRNSKEKLYFTWYIVHDVVSGEEKPNVEAGKKEAMRMVAAGNYDKDLFGEPQDDDRNRDAYDASFGGDDGVGKKSDDGTAAAEDCEECDCLHSMSMMDGDVSRGCFDDKGELLYSEFDQFEEAMSDRGYNSALNGRGVVNSQWITRCYRHNFGPGGDAGDKDTGVFAYSGRDLIIKCQHAFGDGVGDRNFERGEEEEWGTNPENPDTDGDGVVDEADLAGLGQDEFTWIYRKGDKVSVAVEGMSNIAINEGATDRLRYKNKHWDGEEENLDLSPTASPEDWYKERREECQNLRETDSNNAYSDCMKDLWEHQLKDENDEDAFGDMTGYYKIMWAAPGICSENKMEEADNDWCDNDDDIGFQYLKLYDPVERGKQLLEVSVNVSPKNPQFTEPAEGDASEDYGDSTDMIIASADVVGDDPNLNPDYLYYQWSVWRCEPDDFDTCHEVTNEVKWKSFKEGLGVRDVGFYPTEGIFAGNRSLLKVGVVVKRHQNAVMSSPGVNGEYEQQIFSEDKRENYGTPRQFPNKYAYVASKLIEVTRNNLKINLYSAMPDGNGGWQADLKICSTGLYKKVCPVFPYQVLMAEVEGVAGAVAWKLNGKTIQPSFNETVNTEVNSSRVFFPIVGTENSLGRITVTAERADKEGKWEDNNMIEERVFSIHNPMAAIIDPAEMTLGETIKRAFSGIDGRKSIFSGRQLWWNLASWDSNSLTPGVAGEYRPVDNQIVFTVVPNYLEQALEQYKINFKAFVNDDLKQGISANTASARLAFQPIRFLGEPNSVEDLRIRTVINFDDDYKKSLWQAFGIKPVNELVNDLNVKVRNITREEYRRITGQSATGTRQGLLKRAKNKFFALTVKNAPDYLVFTLRLAISFVLVGMTMIWMIRGRVW